MTRPATGRRVAFAFLLRPFAARRQLADLAGGWRFRDQGARRHESSVAGEEQGWFSADCDDTRWPRVRLDIPPALQGVPESIGDWCWFRQRIDIPRSLNGARCWFQMPSIRGRGQLALALWVNGRPVPVYPPHTEDLGGRPYTIDVTDFLEHGSENLFALKVLQGPSAEIGGPGARPPAARPVARLLLHRRPLAHRRRLRRRLRPHRPPPLTPSATDALRMASASPLRRTAAGVECVICSPLPGGPHPCRICPSS